MSFLRASLPILLLGLLEAWLGRIVFVFGTIWIVISCAGIAILTTAWFRAEPLTPAHQLLLRRLILDCIIFVLAIVFFGCIHHVNVI